MRLSKPFLFPSLILAITIHLLVLAIIFFSLRNTPPIAPIHPLHEKRIVVSFSNPLLPQPIITALLRPKVHTLTERSNPSKKVISTSMVAEANTSMPLPMDEETKKLTREDINLLPRSILHHYGDEFFELSAAQQHYLLDNLQKIRKINDLVGNRLLQSKPDEEIDTKENNIVEFYLHPDGSISGLSLYNEREGSLLDELTIDTIELAHTQYPKPKQTTLIRIRVWILVK